ncbi:hypothetical protein [Aquirufa nivalisilvae]
MNKLLSPIRVPFLLLVLIPLMGIAFWIHSKHKTRKIEALEVSIQKAKDYAQLIHWRDSIIILKINHEIDSIKNTSWIYMGTVDRMSDKELQSELSRRFEK